MTVPQGSSHGATFSRRCRRNATICVRPMPQEQTPLAVNQGTPGPFACELAVVGGGLVGMTLAIACAEAGLEVVLLDREDPRRTVEEGFDGRASAIAYGSQQGLDAIGLWAKLADEAEPILEIRVAD